MTTLARLAVLYLPLLTACGDGHGPSFSTPAFTFVANGHTVTRQEYPGVALGLLDSLDNDLFITGSTDPNTGPFENLGLELWAFHGLGTYPLHLNQGDGGSAYYAVTTPIPSTYSAHGGPRDYAYVTHYDAKSGSIEGNFTFTGVDGLTGDTVPVTHGHFIGRIARQ